MPWRTWWARRLARPPLDRVAIWLALLGWVLLAAAAGAAWAPLTVALLGVLCGAILGWRVILDVVWRGIYYLSRPGAEKEPKQ